MSDWFHGAGLGMFVYWDHASQQGLEVSWPLVGGVFALPKCQSVSVEQYHSSAATFDPVDFDARELAACAKRAGMTYAVFTTKHHSGYSMFATELSEFRSPPPGRWETCMTMNHSWGYAPGDTDYKSARELIHTLCEVTGRGGNLLLNVSPTGMGVLPHEQLERLDVMGEWMDRHRESVVGTEAGLEPWQFYGPTTRRGSRTYLHLLARPYETVTVRGLPVRRVRAVADVATGTALEWRTRTGVVESLVPDPPGELTIQVPEALVDEHATVLAVDID